MSHLVARQAGHGQPLAVRAVLQLVWVAHHRPALHLASDRVEEDHRVARGVPDQQRAAVRRQHHVVRLAQDGDAGDLGMAIRVEQADRCLCRIDHEGQGTGDGNRGQQDEGKQQFLHDLSMTSQAFLPCLLGPVAKFQGIARCARLPAPRTTTAGGRALRRTDQVTMLPCPVMAIRAPGARSARTVNRSPCTVRDLHAPWRA